MDAASFGEPRFEAWHGSLRRLLFVGGRLALCEGALQLGLARARVAEQRLLLRGERSDLFVDLCHLLRQPAFALARERQLLLETRDLRVGRVERALAFVQQVAGLVVVRAQRLQTTLGGAQVGLQRFESRVEVGDIGGMALSRARCVLLLGKPEHVLRLLELRLQVAKLGRRPSPALPGSR